jgi:S1-C subfamily serine protease
MRNLQYSDSTVTLEGQLYTDFFYGRPDYGSSPETDDIEHAIMFAADEPFCVLGNGEDYEGNYEGITEDNVSRIQVATTFDTAILRNFLGCGVRLRGHLYHAHTGHHHANVLIFLEVPPVIIDHRNVYTDKGLVGSGSGFLLGSGGLIGTAAHVLDNASDFTVARGLYRQKASVVGVSQEHDLAVLKVEPNGALMDLVQERERKVRPTRTWLHPRLGERVYVFGFPLRDALPHSLNFTEGLVSSELGNGDHKFQISAAIQPGSSGGPAFDDFGNLIGVVTSSLEPAQNLNFCIRSRHLDSLCQQIGLELWKDERRDEKVLPTVLAEEALHFCVEVESWA